MFRRTCQKIYRFICCPIRPKEKELMLKMKNRLQPIRRLTMTSRIINNYIPPSIGIISSYLKFLMINIQMAFYATNLIILNFPLKILNFPLKILNIPFNHKILNTVIFLNFLILNLGVTMIMEKKFRIMNESKKTGNSSLVVDNETLPSCKTLSDEMKMWAIVQFDDCPEADIEEFMDLVPRTWISSRNCLCWYPMALHKSTVQKLAKNCEEVDPKWDCFSMKIMEDGIDNYDKGMKMLVKISKYPNSMLFSDLEEKGKGQRKKKPSKRFDYPIDTSKDYALLKKEKREQPVLLPIPKMASAAQTPAMHLKKNKDNVPQRQSSVLSISENSLTMVNSKEVYVSNVSMKKARFSCKEKSMQHNSLVENRSEPITETFSQVSQVSSKRIGCKMQPKATHKCAYANDGNVMLESLADAVCFLSNELLSCKLIVKKIEKTIDSFIESDLFNNESAPKKQQPLPEMRSNLLDTFPLLNLDELKAFEKKVKTDSTYCQQLIDSLRKEVEGETLQKRINSMLKIIFDDKLASLFNWKGQRGEKQKLKGHRINKIMIEALVDKFPKINETTFGRKAGIWLAQAPSRIKKKRCNNNDDITKIEEDIQSDDCDASISGISDANTSDAKNE